MGMGALPATTRVLVLNYSRHCPKGRCDAFQSSRHVAVQRCKQSRHLGIEAGFLVECNLFVSLRARKRV